MKGVGKMSGKKSRRCYKKKRYTVKALESPTEVPQERIDIVGPRQAHTIEKEA